MFERIVLKTADSKRIEDLHCYWQRRQEKERLLQDLEIENPIAFDDYETLLITLLRTRDIRRINVNNGSGWENFYESQIPDGKFYKTLRYISRRAKENQRRVGHLEVDSYSAIGEKGFRLRFSETNGMIVGYALSFFEHNKDYFTFQGEVPTNPRGYYAIWAPI